MSVDFPAPFSPRSPWIEPASSRSVTPSFARVSPNALWMSLSSSVNVRSVSSGDGHSPRTKRGGLARLPSSSASKVRMPGRVPQDLLAPVIPWSSWGEYQIWVSVAVWPAGRYTDPSCQFSGPLNRTIDPSPSPLTNCDRVPAFAEERAGPLLNPTADEVRLLRLAQSGGSQMNCGLNVWLITDCAIRRYPGPQ